MNIVLLSGGSRKASASLSNDVRSKQFIEIFKTPDHGYESMVQRVYRQIKQINPDANVTIATSKAQVSVLHNQLDSELESRLSRSGRIHSPQLRWQWHISMM